MRLVHAISLALAVSAASAVACGDHVYTGTDEIAVEAFDPNDVLADEAFVASQEFTQDAIQKLLDKTPYGTKSALAEHKEGDESAAAIVLRLAVLHKINPLDLLVRLQMERGLIERASATDADLSYAFNCGCPDGEVCATKPAEYTGFFNQADCAAKSFRQSFDLLDEEDGSTTNGWKVDEAKKTEDGVSVTPKTRATAVLYNYTPYVGGAGGGRASVAGVSGYAEIRARLRSALRGEYDMADGGADAGANDASVVPDAAVTCSPACSAPTSICDTSGPTPRCVQCLADAQCNNGFCNLETNRCVECLPTRAERCQRERSGSVCLANNTCGCGTDTDCGGPTSGRVCDDAKKRCVSGCRPDTSSFAATGNDCPTGQVCLVIQGTDPDIGSCVRATGEETDAGAPREDGGRGPRDRVDPPRGTPATNGPPPLPPASAPGTQSRGGGEEAVEVGNGPDKTRRVGVSCAMGRGDGTNLPMFMLAAVALVVTKRRRSRG